MAIIDVASYGAAGTGGDDTTAIESAITASSPGDIIYFGAGTFGITRTLFPKCSVKGSGRDYTTLLSLPSLTAQMIDVRDKSCLTISDMAFKGSGTYVDAAAIVYGGNAITTQGLTIKRCLFQAHKSPYWVLGVSNKATYDTIIKENKVVSIPEDALSNSTNFAFCQYGTTTGAHINTSIHNNVIDGTGISFGFTLFGSHRKYDISHNEINDQGRSTTYVNSLGVNNAYPILVYAIGNTDEEAELNMAAYGTILGNMITLPTSSGIYIASSSDVLIASNSVRAQTYLDDSLPRGGISLNGVKQAHVTGNLIHDCAIGINLGGTSGVWNTTVSGNSIKSYAGGATIGIKAASAVPAGHHLSITNNDVYLTSSQSSAYSVSLTGTGKAFIRNNTSQAANHGLTATTSATRDIGDNSYLAV